MLTIDDFVMLGKTVPEPNSDGRVFVCSAGISQTLRSLIRIYPLARRHAPPRWTVSTVSLIRNPKDSRIESFKLAGDRAPGAHEHINEAFTWTSRYTNDLRADLLRPYTVETIAEANARRLSLAVLHPDHLALEFEHNPESPDSPELRLFDVDDQPTAGAKRFAYIPRLHFYDAGVDRHLMLRDWGTFEFLRKHGDARRYELASALHLDGCSLLVGNFNRHRPSWLAISVLRGVRPAPSLLDELEVSAS
jgi:hypothetical protein